MDNTNTSIKIIYLNSTILIFILNVSCLKTPIQRDIVSLKNNIHLHAVNRKTTLNKKPQKEENPKKEEKKMRLSQN